MDTVNAAIIDWDAVELLPKFRCCACSAVAVPWGRTPDDRYFCSKRCSDAVATSAAFATAPPPATARHPRRWPRGLGIAFAPGARAARPGTPLTPDAQRGHHVQRASRMTFRDARRDAAKRTTLPGVRRAISP